MRQSNLIIFDHLSQSFTRQTWKLAELSQQPAETVERSAQQTLAFRQAEFGKGDLQIAQTGSSQTRRQKVCDAAEQSAQANRQRARQDTVKRQQGPRAPIFGAYLKISFRHRCAKSGV